MIRTGEDVPRYFRGKTHTRVLVNSTDISLANSGFGLPTFVYDYYFSYFITLQ